MKNREGSSDAYAKLIRLTPEQRARVHRERNLTPRQQEVLDLLLQGQTVSQVAHTLDISPSTVRHHVENLHLRFRVSSRVELMLSVMQIAYPERFEDGDVERV